MRYSKYGINAMFQEPVERSAALKLVRATNMLVLHEFRRYVRIPVMTEVAIQVSEGRKFTATSIEVSSGGMSIKSAEDRRHRPGRRSLIRAADFAAPLGPGQRDLEKAQTFFRRPLRRHRRAPPQAEGMDRRLPGELAASPLIEQGQLGFGESHAAATKHTVIRVKKRIGKRKKYLQLRIVTAKKQRANAHAARRMSARVSAERPASCHANTAANRTNTETKNPDPSKKSQ